MQYFTRLNNTTQPSNRLKTYVMQEVEKLNFLLVDDPEALKNKIDEIIQFANSTYRQCTRQANRVNRDFKSREITSFNVDGLFNLSLHKVAGQFGQVTPKKAPEPATTPDPAPDSAPLATDQPRQVIFKSRDCGKTEKLEPWGSFPPEIQTLLQTGRIWSVYYSPVGTMVAEEFGGKTHLLKWAD